MSFDARTSGYRGLDMTSWLAIKARFRDEYHDFLAALWIHEEDPADKWVSFDVRFQGRLIYYADFSNAQLRPDMQEALNVLLRPAARIAAQMNHILHQNPPPAALVTGQ